MNIAVITGASSGLGEKFANLVDKVRNDIDEIWLIARRENRLKEVAKSLKKPTKVLRIDITNCDDIENYKIALNESGNNVKLLINNAGYGKLGRFDELTAEENAGMIRLNCEALTVFTAVTLPLMANGGEIINTCSIASFAPNTSMAVYSSTKAFVMSLSRALRLELKNRRINVLAACPGPMTTEFLAVAGIEKGNSKAFDRLPRVDAYKMAKGALKASKKKRAVYTNGIFYKFYRLVAKFLPKSIVMLLCGTEK